MTSIEASQNAAPQIFDSLPYYDNELDQDPILKEKVTHELAVETQKLQQETLHPRVPPAVEIFSVRAPSSLSFVSLDNILQSPVAFIMMRRIEPSTTSGGDETCREEREVERD